MTAAPALTVGAPTPPVERAAHITTHKRADIQGLRALAVSLVVVYHLFPHSLTGGFVGVDVFFAVSGFLITSHLLLRRPSRPRHLLDFWARRIRRLLPASLLVLLVTLVLTRVLAPATQWDNTARQAAAAATYVENWVLARQAVDYLAADDAASPVQHFWSLSVEEQFYLGWPVLVLLLGLLALAVGRLGGTARSLRATYVWGLGAVVVASLAWSIHLTGTDPARAYFVTPTRIWELGLGGLVAAVVVVGDRPARFPAPVAAAAAWLGLAAIAWSGITYTGETPFPGWQAIVPVGGAAVVLGLGAVRHPWSPGRLLGLPPLQWLGDVSYSVYLWHWPLLVLVPFVGRDSVTLVDKGVVAVLTLVLAGLTKTYVEDAFRTPQWNRRLVPTYALGAVGMAAVVATASLLVAAVNGQEDDARTALARARAAAGECFGAGAMLESRHCAPVTADPVPAPALAAKDRSAAYPRSDGDRNCFSSLPAYRTVRCTFGDRSSDTTVALVGNSHAGQWLPALQRIARAEHWRIDTYLSSRCAAADLRQQFDTAAQSTACSSWARRVSEEVSESRPDLVVLSNRVSVPAEGQRTLEASKDAYVEGYESLLRTWSDAHLPVVVVRDTPAPGDGGTDSVPDCVAAHADDLAACEGDRSAWVPADPTVDAAHALDAPGVRTVDLNDRICGAQTCEPVVGGVLVYFDGSHLTATYDRTLAPYLRPVLVRAMDGRASS